MKLTILVLEDESEVRDAILRDLREFASLVRLEPAEDVADAWAVVDEVTADGDVIALVLADHRLPGESGVDFLVQMQSDERTIGAQTVLVTGQADQADTIRALNHAGLDHYISKPWQTQELRAVVRDQLTDFVLAYGIDPIPYMPVLDQVRAFSALRSGTD